MRFRNLLKIRFETNLVKVSISNFSNNAMLQTEFLEDSKSRFSRAIDSLFLPQLVSASRKMALPTAVNIALLFFLNSKILSDLDAFI